MSIIGIILGVCVLGIGIWSAQNHQGSVFSVVDIYQENTPTPSPSTSPSPLPSSTPSNVPNTITTAPTKTPSNTPIPNNSNESNTSISRFHYPNAAVISSSNSQLELTSSDSHSAITDWYKSTINALGLNTKSFVTTNTNDSILNKLVATGKGTDIRVEITKEPSNSTVKIVVGLK